MIKIKKDSDGKIVGKIDLISYSMGYTYAKCLTDFLADPSHFSERNILGYFYAIAAENAMGVSDAEYAALNSAALRARYDINELQYEGIYQYGSDWVNEKACRQDGVAVQARIRKLDPENNEYIPMFNDDYVGIRDFLNAHFMKNYGWMLDELDEEKDDRTFIRKR